MTHEARLGKVGLVLAIVLLINLPNLLFPLFEDTALFLAVGDFMLQGLVPYRDLVVQKPPGIFIITWLIGLTVGTSDLAFRIVELVVIATIAFGCGRIARHTELRGSWLVGTLAGGVLCSTRLWTLSARGQVEFFQLAALTWSVALVLEHLLADAKREARSARRRRMLLVGALVGLACWLKPQAAILGVGLVVFVLVHASRRRPARDGRWRSAAPALWMACGVVGVSVPVWIWMLQTGGVAALVQSVLVGNAEYVLRAPERPLAVVLQTSFFFPFERPLGLLAFCGAVTLLVRSSVDRRVRLLTLLLLLWWLSAGLQVMTGGYLFGYHKIVLVGPASIFVAAGLCGLGALLYGIRPGKSGPTLQDLALAGGVALLLVHPRFVLLQRHFWEVVLTERSLEEAHAALGVLEPFYDYAEQARAAEHVRRRCAPDETVQVLGRAGLFWLRVDRRPATRYLVTDPVLAGSEPERSRFADSLARARPCYLLVRREDVFPWFGHPASERLVRRDPRMNEILTSLYESETTIGKDLMLFRRR